MNTQIKDYLQDIIDNEPSRIRAFVADEILSSDNPMAFLEDVSQYGCRSGLVNSLIYYTDTHKFFDQHYSEIEKIRNEFEDRLGFYFDIRDDLKTWCAWFAFEEIAYRLHTEIEELIGER